MGKKRKTPVRQDAMRVLGFVDVVLRLPVVAVRRVDEVPSTARQVRRPAARGHHQRRSRRASPWIVREASRIAAQYLAKLDAPGGPSPSS
ncbi:MAG TPA: hypothetical protein VKY56_03920 [Chloroflexota bacterium]|nr:hypothetical protein [Chloroflexota bacterium]